MWWKFAKIYARVELINFDELFIDAGWYEVMYSILDFVGHKWNVELLPQQGIKMELNSTR